MLYHHRWHHLMIIFKHITHLMIIITQIIFTTSIHHLHGHHCPHHENIHIIRIIPLIPEKEVNNTTETLFASIMSTLMSVMILEVGRD